MSFRTNSFKKVSTFPTHPDHVVLQSTQPATSATGRTLSHEYTTRYALGRGESFVMFLLTFVGPVAQLEFHVKRPKSFRVESYAEEFDRCSQFSLLPKGKDNYSLC